MKVKVFGFELHVGAGISYADFFSYLSTASVDQDDSVFTIVDPSQAWVMGVIVRVSDQKRWTALRRKGGKLRISSEELDKDTSIAQVNFFILDQKKGRGLYQSYHGGTSLNAFCSYLKQSYKALKNRKIAEEMKALTKAGDTLEAAQRKAGKKYSKSLQYSVLERQGELIKKVAALQSVRALMFESVDYVPDSSEYAPLNNKAKRIAHKISYGKEGVKPVGAFKQAIASVFRNHAGRSLRVQGVDPDGNEVLLKAFHDFEPFSEEEYDNLVFELDISLDMPPGELRKTAAIAYLTEIADGAIANARLSA